VIVRVEPVMGTVVSFHLDAGELSEADATAAIDDACSLLHRMDDVFSTWKPESPMSRLRAGEIDLSEAPPEVSVVLELCRAAKQMSGEWFDPWAMPGGLDPTGLVKGWAVEEARAVVESAGAAAGIVNGGGDIATFGEAPGGGAWRVGIRHPWRASALACVLEVAGAVATSGAYERPGHLIDPRDGSEPGVTASATVTGPSLALADALATALAVGGDEVLELVRAAVGYDAYLIRADGSEAATEGIVFAAPELPANL